MLTKTKGVNFDEAYLLRRSPDAPDKLFVAVLPNIGIDDKLAPTVLRSLCVQLAIMPKHFGYQVTPAPEDSSPQ